MKNTRKNIIILVFIITISIMINFVLIINKIEIVKESKKTIKEMTEGEYESKLTELNKSHEDYALQVQENKRKLATAITNQKVETSEDDTIDEIVTNIGKILKVGTSDANATSEDILEGKTAYVNGELIVGTGEDIETANSDIKNQITSSYSTASVGTITYTTTKELEVVFAYCSSKYDITNEIPTITCTGNYKLLKTQAQNSYSMLSTAKVFLCEKGCTVTSKLSNGASRSDSKRYMMSTTIVE